MSCAEKRTDQRFPCEIAVELVWNKQRTRLRTVDVSYHGMFLRTDTPPSLRQLIRLEIPMPDGSSLTLHGMAVHVVTPDAGPGREPGVGVQFYAVDAAAARTWSRFVDETRRRSATPSAPEIAHPRPSTSDESGARPAPAPPPLPTAVAAPPVGPPPLPRRGPPPLPIRALRPRLSAPDGLPRADAEPDPARRRFPRYDAEIELELRTVEELHRLVTRDVSAGGMYILTDAPFELGLRVRIHVHHPGARPPFHLDAVVRRRGTTPLGIGVEFADLSPERREQLVEFLRPSLPLDEVVLVEEGDPSLA